MNLCFKNLGRLLMGVSFLSVSGVAFATTDSCKTEAREITKIIRTFNKAPENFSVIVATLQDENIENDHLLTYEMEYVDPVSGEKGGFSDTVLMKWQNEGRADEQCILEKFEKGGA